MSYVCLGGAGGCFFRGGVGGGGGAMGRGKGREREEGEREGMEGERGKG